MEWNNFIGSREYECASTYARNCKGIKRMKVLANRNNLV